MVFSSVLFLFYFLPIVLAGYFLSPRPLRNFWLLAASLFFYAWGEVYYIFLMLFSVGANYLFGRLIAGNDTPRTRRIYLGVALFLNLGLLGVFKYANFIADSLAPLTAMVGLGAPQLPDIPLPIGISFFTFQAMSYVIDVYQRNAKVQRNPLDLALYIALFPQLIAGPIVRYHDIATQLAHRIVTREGFTEGLRRFILGMAKKVLIANTMAVPADQIFALPPSELTWGVAWLGALCYTLQIYFDFSGYSDMAIGLGRMFGFRFMENFNYPYIARSIREFWRRWHISLSTWFRDYLYIPLGGNRGSGSRTHFNLVLVFFLCGLWHGAAWNFVIWGFYHGGFLVLERTAVGRALDRAWAPVQHVYALLVVIVGWVFFRAESLPQALSFLRAMAGFANPEGVVRHPFHYLTNEIVLMLGLGCLCAVPLLPLCLRWLDLQSPSRTVLVRSAGYVLCLGLFVLSCMALAAQTHNPFIYFRF